MLETIFTGYPRWKLQEEKLPREKVKTFPWLMTAYLARTRLRLSIPWVERELGWLATQSFDAHVSSRLPSCDVFIGLSSFALKSGQTARRRGAKYVCDRGSSHIRFQDRILREEFARWGQEFSGVNPRILRKEEAEYEAADLITVPSQFAFNSFVKCGVAAGRIRIIPYGVELNRFRPLSVPDRDRFNVLAVGQVSFRKGFPYLFEAFQRLRHPHKRLIVAGAVQPEIKRWLRGRKLDHVEFLGSLPQAELPDVMSRAHVLVLASVEDGLALVLAQAMGCGCPVIATEHSGGPDLFDHGQEGFLVAIRDARAIVDRLEQLAQDHALRESMSAAALQRVKEVGGWDSYGQQFERLCRELVGGAAPAPLTTVPSTAAA